MHSLTFELILFQRRLFPLQGRQSTLPLHHSLPLPQHPFSRMDGIAFHRMNKNDFHNVHHKHCKSKLTLNSFPLTTPCSSSHHPRAVGLTVMTTKYKSCLVCCSNNNILKLKHGSKITEIMSKCKRDEM